MNDETIELELEEVKEEVKSEPKKRKPKKVVSTVSAEKYLYRKVGSSVSVWRTEEAIKNSGEEWEKVED